MSPENPVREAVGVFVTPDALQNAIDELLSSGSDRAEISLLASEAAVVEKLRHRYRKAEVLEDHVSVPRAAYVSTESVGDAEGAVIGGLMYVAAGVLMGPVGAAGGSLAAIAMAGALGAGIGGLVGLPIAHYIGEQKTRRIEEQLAHGGPLLWVRVWNAERERCAVDILERNAGRDVHVHEFA